MEEVVEEKKDRFSRIKNPRMLSLSAWAAMAAITLIGLATYSFGWLKPWQNLMLLAFVAGYIPAKLKICKTPNVLRAYMFDSMIGKLESGWHLEIPGLLKLEEVEIKWFPVEFRDCEFYCIDDKEPSERTILTCSGQMQIRQDIDKNSLRKSLQMSPAEMVKQMRKVAITRLQAIFGPKRLSEIISKFGEVENDEGLKTRLSKETEQYGYKWRDFELNMESQTTRIESMGRARGRAAEAVSGPLRNNFPAAMVSAVQVVSDTARDILGDKRKKRSSDEGSQEQSTESQPAEQTIAQAIRSAFQGR